MKTITKEINITLYKEENNLHHKLSDEAVLELIKSNK